ncbi:MAG: hypothetical protein FJX76_01145 [Armatimonadetes bacterium]|nr:hypothetical protein [Armatimonadota bacterium]
MNSLGSLTTFAPSLPADYKTPQQPGNKTLGKDDFLKLFLTQLKHQDPEKAQDQSQMLAQMAQFTSLEQMQNLNKTQESANAASQLGAASNLIGRTISVRDGEDIYSGTVSSVKLEKGLPKLVIGLRSFDLKNLITVQ